MTPPQDDSQINSLSGQVIHDLRAPLTVIKAQAQMLERWLQRNDIPEPDAALARLAMIDAMVAKLVLELDALSEVHPPDDTGGEVDTKT